MCYVRMALILGNSSHTTIGGDSVLTTFKNYLSLWTVFWVCWVIRICYPYKFLSQTNIFYFWCLSYISRTVEHKQSYCPGNCKSCSSTSIRISIQPKTGLHRIMRRLCSAVRKDSLTGNLFNQTAIESKEVLFSRDTVRHLPSI